VRCCEVWHGRVLQGFLIKMERPKKQTKYPKIQTIFERNKQFKVVENTLNPKLIAINNIKRFTIPEKVDGS